jgi:uncharacterized protein DUF2726
MLPHSDVDARAVLVADAAATRMRLYTLRQRFFTRSEGSFYRALRVAVGSRFFIFAKVRLLDLVDVSSDDMVAKNWIRSKHIDFVLCHPATLEQLVAIEVDGPSHKRVDRIARDRFLNALCAQVDLPLIRIPAATWFEPSEVLARIDAALASH